MNQQRPVIFGEVLFDCFPNGKTVLGGAPFNVAWHLQNRDCEPLLISSVGNDKNGEAVRQAMSKQGMDTVGLQTSEHYPTGQVVVSIEAGQPSYEIVTDQAYDHIDHRHALQLLEKLTPALIYHGSLALRNAASRAALDAIVENARAPVFLDVNLRDPWWDMALLKGILQRATWVKLNDEELCTISGQPVSNGPELQTYAKNIFTDSRLESLIVTRGDKGAFVVCEEGIVEGAPVPVENVVDTVGAGDAFSAICIEGIIKKRPIVDTLDQALTFAARICQQQGATG
ncbi:MAG TPA: carbohydrate kinase [Gammaproteobacteria bacterium]|nr:carbohydrate kinase [Gammaproteobacteria bacterium]